MKDFRIDFIIIGAMKSGTTTLASVLARHPDVCFSSEKEPHFFNRFSDWNSRLQEYHKYFDDPRGRICGEASTHYSCFPEWPDTARRIAEYNPEMKLVYVLRDPVDRILSHFAYDVARGRVPNRPDEILLRQPRYLNRSRYGLQLRQFLRHFPKDQLHVMIFEELMTDPALGLRTLASFLGLSGDEFSDDSLPVLNPSVGRDRTSEKGRKVYRFFKRNTPHRKLARFYPDAVRRSLHRALTWRMVEKPAVSDTLRGMLVDLAAADVHEVERLVDRPISAWRSRTMYS